MRRVVHGGPAAAPTLLRDPVVEGRECERFRPI